MACCIEYMRNFSSGITDVNNGSNTFETYGKRSHARMLIGNAGEISDVMRN